MSSAGQAIRCLFHKAAGMPVARIQPNTWIGQIRRTASGATITASTMNAAGPRWCGSWTRVATVKAAAATVTSASNTQRPAARFARYPAGLSILMLAIVPPVRRPIVAAARPRRR